jgi:IS5 family transposase
MFNSINNFLVLKAVARSDMTPSIPNVSTGCEERERLEKGLWLVSRV